MTGHADDDLPGGSPTPRAVDRAEPAAPLSAEGRALHDRFVGAIDDDLDLPTALATVRETLRASLSHDERRWLVLDADAVLGLDLDRVWDQPDGEGAHVDRLPAPIQSRLDRRASARADRDYARADALRDELADLGWEIVDEAGGTRATRRG